MSHTSLIVEHSDTTLSEYHSLQNTCGLLDLSKRGRLCLTGKDRVTFLHGQITQDIKSLSYGQGAFAALVDGKGKIQSDLNVYILKDEILLDFEQGYTQTITQRLEHHLVSEEVEIVDPSEFYTMLSLQGPKSVEALNKVLPDADLPEGVWDFTEIPNDEGAIYICNRPRFGCHGFDLFIPTTINEGLKENLIVGVESLEGMEVHQTACEIARIQAGVPRMGADMTPVQLVQETGLTSSAISFRKGCYIGQEVISRIRTVGKVNKSLCRLSFDKVPSNQIEINTPLMVDGNDAGFVTSLSSIPGQEPPVSGLGYVKSKYIESCDSFLLVEPGGNTIKAQISGEPRATGIEE